jgi:hypothetical protein
VPGPLLGPSRQREQRDDRVEVAVREPTARAAAIDGSPQPAGPARRSLLGAVPQDPQRILDHAAVRQSLGCRTQHERQVPRGGADRRFERGEYGRLRDGLADQLVGGTRKRRGATGQRFLGAQGSAEAAQVAAVETGERAGQQRARGIGGQGGRIGGAAQREQQGGDRRLAGQRQLVGVHLDRDVSRGQRPAKRAELTTRAGEHGHVGPIDALLEMRAAQQVGERGLLDRGRREGQHADGAVRRPALARLKIAVLAHLLRGQPRQRHPAGHAAGRPQQRRPGAATRSQYGDRRGLCPVRAESVGELQDPVQIRAAEGVDRLVGIAHHDQLAAVPGERLQQPDLRRIGVLVFVHEDHAVGGAQLLAHLGGLGDEHGAMHQFGVVQHAARVGHVQVLGEEARRRPPVRPVRALGELAQPRRVEALLPRAQQHGPQLLREAPRPQRGAQGRGPARLVGRA